MVSAAAPSRRTRSRRWLWFFAVLVILSIVGMVIPYVYHRLTTLNVHQLHQAEALWEQQGPKSYLLEYSVAMPGEPPATWVVTIRGGKADSVFLRAADGTLQKVTEVQKMAFRGMPDLFEFAQMILDEQGKLFTAPALSNWMYGSFDARDGHVLHMVRRTAADQLFEVKVLRFEPLPDRE